MINFEKLSTKFKVRTLVETDIPMILEVYKSNPMYFEHCPPSPTKETVRDDMFSLPPNKSIHDKYYLGFFDGEALITVMDIIEAYPQTGIVFWGLFIMASHQSGKGLGSQIVEECISALKEQGFQSVRLSYMKTNPQSKAFWEKCGFNPTGVETNNGTGIAVVMERNLN